jgi:hypothetical protein
MLQTLESEYADCILVSCCHMTGKVLDLDQVTGKLQSALHGYLSCDKCSPAFQLKEVQTLRIYSGVL